MGAAMNSRQNRRGVRGWRDPAMERDIGQAVRRAREAAGLSAEEMADRMGLSPSQLRRMEDAATIVTVSHLAAAARVLGVPVSRFYGHHDPLRQTTAAHTGWMAHPESRDLVAAYMAAPPSVRESFATLLQALSRR
jgi:transcriptional regulator with XRE-family HTH domain